MDDQKAPDPDAPSVVEQPDKRRYTVRVGDRVAGFTAYRRQGDVTTFTHTEIANEHEGQGLGSLLVKGALDDVRARGGTIRPLCPFVRSYIERHPEYGDLVAGGHVR